MAHNLALVLGGGGAAGNAWEIGVVAGLADVGFDLTRAPDLVIGTSAGATAAAQIGSGLSPAELLAAALAAPLPPASDLPRPPTLPMQTVISRMREISEAAMSAEDIQHGMGRFGLEADAVIGSGAPARRAQVATRFDRRDWPDRPTMITAVNAHTGVFTVFDGDSGVDLVDAVTASCALPGLVPTHEIGGSHFIDGGVRSSENADLAAGYATVVILAPLGRTSESRTSEETDAARQFEGLRRARAWGTDLSGQVDALRAGGSRVELIVPDEGSRSAMGANLMNPATRIPAARAGFEQGRRSGERLSG